MEKRIILVIVCAMVLVIACGDLYAFDSKSNKYGQEKSSSNFFKKSHQILKANEQLKLSDTQVEKIVEEKINAKKAVIRAEAEIMIISLDIKMGLKEDKVDLKLMNKLVDQKFELKKNKTKRLIGAYARIKSILTKEQNNMLPEIYKNKKLEKHVGRKYPYNY
ncbi:MAG: hypothetical protein KAS13_07280 [Candidatus Omnitrophica bacterium]|nr:hypothetical protein [Candidatus Omnitrophota bacterium]